MSVETKVCARCNTEYPKTEEFFGVRRDRTNGFKSWCRKCTKVYMREHDQKRRLDPAFQAWQREYKQKLLTDPKYRERQQKYDRDRRADPIKRERRREYQQKLQADPLYRERRRKYYLQRYADPTVRIQKREYYKANPHISRVISMRRKARKRNLPDNFTDRDWRNALDYFENRCAVCERVPELGRILSADHWIPLTSPDCLGTVPQNIVPLCYGKEGCNNSKHNRDAKEWLVEKFGEVEAARILARIEAYFASLENEGVESSNSVL